MAERGRCVCGHEAPPGRALDRHLVKCAEYARVSREEPGRDLDPVAEYRRAHASDEEARAAQLVVWRAELQRRADFARDRWRSAEGGYRHLSATSRIVPAPLNAVFWAPPRPTPMGDEARGVLAEFLSAV